MKDLDYAILSTLAGVAIKHQKPYCYPSQRTILGLLKNYHGTPISRRTLNRRLKLLQNEAYFSRVRRIMRGKDGIMVFRSTLYKLGWKLFNYMGSLRKEVRAFFSFFRVPFLANHHPKGGEASTNLDRPPVDKPVDNYRKGSKTFL